MNDIQVETGWLGALLSATSKRHQVVSANLANDAVGDLIGAVDTGFERVGQSTIYFDVCRKTLLFHRVILLHPVRDNLPCKSKIHLPI